MSWRRALGRRRRAAAFVAVHAAWGAVQRAGTITAESPAGRRFAAFGQHSMMAFPTGAVYGERWIEVGDETMFAELVTLCAGMMPGHDLGDQPVVRVGSRCVIGRGSHIVAHHSIVIGDDVYTGPYVYVTDQNHSYADPDAPIGRQWPVNSAVSIGAGTWLGAGAIVLPGACIGENVVVAAGSVVRGKVPDRCVVAGIPAKIVREYVSGTGWSRPSD
jgi:serine acetyltransferase